jgi:beta-galactosidase
MKDLLGSDYFPFGSQYYRAPSPRPEEWERDHAAMAGLGFNTVKYWVQWRWNHPERDRFYFDDIDRLMDVAHQKGLRVMLNTIVDVAPAWIYRQYPDASMLTLDGRRIGPQTQGHRQIGGLGVCLNHAEVMDHLFRFLEATIERYSDHPALEIWNVGSEPELTQSMSEMRLYADDASKMGDMLCFCDHCRRGFKSWLAEKYGTIAALNRSWNRNYQSWEEAEVPKTRNTFNDLIDWRMYFVHTLGENVRRRFEVAQRVDAGRHPLMCHHVFIQGFPVTSTANDPWNVARFGDLHGFTQMDDPMMHDILRSSSRGKPIISAEMLMLMGYTLKLHEKIDADDIKRHIFTGIAADVKGFVFWQYRPETLGREAPAWGLSHLDGSSTPWLESFAEVGRALQDHSGFLMEAETRPPDVAIFYSPENQIFAWAASGSEKTATDSLLGFHRALYEQNFRMDFIHPVEITADLLSRYRVVVVPFPYVLSERIAALFTDWVRDGGVLIGECYFGGWNLEEGRHQTSIPGYGLTEVFGVRQRWVGPADEGEFTVVDGVVRSVVNDLHARGLGGAPSTGFSVGRLFDASGGVGQVEIVVEDGNAGIRAGERAFGAFVKEVVDVDGAQVLARFNDGEAAVTAAAFGRGWAIRIGSYVGVMYHRRRYPGNGRLISGLVDWAVGIERPEVIGE